MAHSRGSTDGAEVDPTATVDDDVIIGYDHDGAANPARIGPSVRVRSGTVIYADVSLAAGCQTGHHVTVREATRVGEDGVIGTNVVIDGQVTIGARASLQTGVYLPPGTTLGDDVFVGPYAVFTNDPYPLRVDAELVGPTLEDHVSVGANATVLPGVTIGRGSFVAAGAVVTDDVPPGTLAVGTPASNRQLPEHLAGGNVAR